MNTRIVASFRRTAAFIFLFTGLVFAQGAGQLEEDFLKPPTSARPWVYWFWLNGNITKEGITADLEAMKRVGIGGVLIMEVDQGTPVGPADFLGPRWRELFKHVDHEARRLRLQVNMNNDAGWNGSGGPWITPAQSMQKIVWKELDLTGPRHYDATFPEPEKNAGFYKDICVLALPKSGSYRIPHIRAKAGFELGAVDAATPVNVSADAIVDRKGVVVLTRKMDPNGRLVWEVPEGEWTVIRFGHTTTGVENAPAPKSGRGLECDKLDITGMDANFNGMMQLLVEDTGLKPKGREFGLNATHIDSWENGSQNWTTQMRQEFYEKRGYDLEPFLPVVTGRVVDSPVVSERFLWDLRKTISELVIEKYAGRMKELSHAAGLRFTAEAYGSPCDFLPYAGQSDEPMGEFWTPSGMLETCKGMASAGHTYGKRVIGAEAFTADAHERWLEHPGILKSLGDRAFCDGINRFVFHRYAMQPWEPARRPGMMMGPWGQHYERTQTWWEHTGAWHEYLTRCQFLLREGRFVADICYLQAEAPPMGFNAHPRNGYDWDECAGDTLQQRVTVLGDRLVMPDGMNYRVLALPESATMTPELLRSIRNLAQAGATIIGAPPERSPSLNRHPRCDNEIKDLVAEIWADCDGVNMKKRRFGKGLIVRGIEPEQFLKEAGVPPDFSGPPQLRYIHRATATEDLYFIANSARNDLVVNAAFRMSGKLPELWWPETGKIEKAALFHQSNGVTSVSLSLPASGSVFVVFRDTSAMHDGIVSLSRDGNPLFENSALPVTVIKARYGVLSDPARTRDVRNKLQRLIDSGETMFRVARMAEGDDPAYLVVKTLEVDYRIGEKTLQASGTDPEEIDLTLGTPSMPTSALVHADEGAPGLVLEAWQPGQYTARTASGRTLVCSVGALPAPRDLNTGWQVRFQSSLDKKAGFTEPFDKLISWAEHPKDQVRYFSGTATYASRVSIERSMLDKRRRLYFDAGDTKAMARLRVNGRDLGIAYRPPFRWDITKAARGGENRIELEVVNLWPNRLIGDEQLPEDSDRNADGTLKTWPQWVLDGKPSPAGRQAFVSWRLWKKGDKLEPSGLLGPVRLYCSELSPLR